MMESGRQCRFRASGPPAVASLLAVPARRLTQPAPPPPAGGASALAYDQLPIVCFWMVYRKINTPSTLSNHPPQGHAGGPLRSGLRLCPRLFRALRPSATRSSPRIRHHGPDPAARPSRRPLRDDGGQDAAPISPRRSASPVYRHQREDPYSGLAGLQKSQIQLPAPVILHGLLRSHAAQGNVALPIASLALEQYTPNEEFSSLFLSGRILYILVLGVPRMPYRSSPRAGMVCLVPSGGRGAPPSAAGLRPAAQLTAH
jgi:hypothetical protein